MRVICLATVWLLAGACTQSPTLPGVRIAADPPPPYTYWAPAGSVIVNHPDMAGVWIARAADGRDTYYFGDACGAAARQDWIGRSRDALPSPMTTGPLRVIEPDRVVTADLNFNRLNVEFDADGRVSRVFCS